MPLTLPFRIGTRGSPLARAQAAEVAARLTAAHGELAAAGAVETVIIRTTGDRVTDRPLAEIGGKGLFTKEIEEALIDRRIDVAVHSMKDVPTWLPDGLMIAAILPREDPRDALISRGDVALDALPDGAVIGTASLRRAAQLRARRPGLKVVPLRGNVGTRLDKLSAGAVDATLLAMAGLNRLGRAGAVSAVLAPEAMLPAVAQGAIGLECRTDDEPTIALLAALDHAPSARAVAAERAMLAVLDGSCRTPIAGLAVIDGTAMTLRGLIAKPDGSVLIEHRDRAPEADAERLGRAVGERLLAEAGPGFLDG